MSTCRDRDIAEQRERVYRPGHGTNGTPPLEVVQDAVAASPPAESRRTTRSDLRQGSRSRSARPHRARAASPRPRAAPARRRSSSSAPDSPGSAAAYTCATRATSRRSTRHRTASAALLDAARRVRRRPDRRARRRVDRPGPHRDPAARAASLGLKLDNLLQAEQNGTELLGYFDGAPYRYAEMTDDIKAAWQKIHADVSAASYPTTFEILDRARQRARQHVDRRLDRGDLRGGM